MSASMTNAAVSARKANAISRAVGMTTQIYADRAENSEIWDIEGRPYVDFAGGIAVDPARVGGRTFFCAVRVEAPLRPTSFKRQLAQQITRRLRRRAPAVHHKVWASVWAAKEPASGNAKY